MPNKSIDAFVKNIDDLEKDIESLKRTKRLLKKNEWASTGEDLKPLAWHILSKEKIGPFHPTEGRKWHDKLIELLRASGFSEQAEELSLYRPSEREIRHAGSINFDFENPSNPFHRSGSRDAEIDFRTVSAQYHRVCDKIIEELGDRIDDQAWFSDAIRNQY